MVHAKAVPPGPIKTNRTSVQVARWTVLKPPLEEDRGPKLIRFPRHRLKWLTRGGTVITIRVAAKTPQDRGDTFTRLLSDFFTTLGYEECRFNIAKAGREIDVSATHRTEQRALRAECKATSAKIGGRHLNTFAGALQVEATTSPIPLQGYFVSLSGYTESARQQERDAGARLILLDGEDIVRDLQTAGLLTSLESATEAAGRLLGEQRLNLAPIGTPLLVAHSSGWYWALPYGSAHMATHVMLVHADGSCVHSLVSTRIAALVPELASLATIGPIEAPDVAERNAKALRRYMDYIDSQCSTLTLEGLPLDLASPGKPIALESFYVPLKMVTEGVVPGVPSGAGGNIRIRSALPFSVVQRKHQHVAVLGGPGAGKTTLLRHHALMLLRSARRDSRKPIPLLLRCRQLRGQHTFSVSSIVTTLAAQLEIPSADSSLVALLQERLQDGTAVLLIDGLDEIADDGLRAAFCTSLRTLIALYPQVPVIVTSREPGFRAVSGALHGICDRFTIAPLNREDIRVMTRRWFLLTCADVDTAEQQAAQFSSKIVTNQRVRDLATTPLLLATILLVGRWVGELPRRRAALYEEAIAVLLRTWNVEGHEPLDLDESIPQLAYVAREMMAAGVQSFSGSELKRSVGDARKSLPQILGYTRISPAEFTRRVEERSSLLTQVGHIDVNGRLDQLYEFKHLSFQEYLAALAVVQGYLPTNLQQLGWAAYTLRHLDDTSWREVLPLAGVLSGGRAGELIKPLERRARTLVLESDCSEDPPRAFEALAECLSDEPQIEPRLAQRVCATLADGLAKWPVGNNTVRHLSLTRYAPILRAALGKVHEASSAEYEHFLLNTLGVMTLATLGLSDLAPPARTQTSDLTAIAKAFRVYAAKEDITSRAVAAYLAMHWAYRVDVGLATDETNRPVQASPELVEFVVCLATTEDPRLHTPAIWAMAWLLQGRSWKPTPSEAAVLVPRLIRYWKSTRRSPETRRFAAWALAYVPITPTLKVKMPSGPSLDRFLLKQIEGEVQEKRLLPFTMQAACVTMMLNGGPLSDKELRERIKYAYESHRSDHQSRRLLRILTERQRKISRAAR